MEKIQEETGGYHYHYKVSKFREDIDACKTPEKRVAFEKNHLPYEVREGDGNTLLNTGINKMWDLIVGIASGTSHEFSNAKATIGIGDDDTAAVATQTDLQGNTTYKGMEATYPQTASQKVTFKSSFGAGDANYEWAEWVIKQLTSSVCLNRKVEALGTKDGGTWVIELSLALS